MGALFSGCPGAASIRGAPTIKEMICPNCGEIIEIFSIDTQVKCDCGFVAYNDALSCVKWCKYAHECVGDDAYNRIMNSENRSD